MCRLARGLDQPPFGKGGDDLFLMIVIVLVALRVAGNRDHAASVLATGDERAGAAMSEDDVSLVQYGADIVERQAVVNFHAFGTVAAGAALRDSYERGREGNGGSSTWSFGWLSAHFKKK